MILFILIGLALFELLTDNKKITWVTGSILALFAGLRHYSGYDFNSYGLYYYEADSFRVLFDGSVRLESGFLFLSTLFSSIGLNYYTFVLFFSLLSLGLLTYFLYRYVPYPSMVLAYYYGRFYMARDMGQVRGAFAAIILLYSIIFLIKKQPLKFMLVIFIASLFHVTAWAFIVLYPINTFFEKINVKNSMLLIGLSFLFGIFIQTPSLYIWAIPQGYRAYFTSASHTNGAWLAYPILWMQLIILFGMITLRNRNHIYDNEWINILLKIYLVSPMVLIAAGRLETVGGRISTLFATIEMLIVPYFFINMTRYKMLNIIFYGGFSLVIFTLIFILSGMYNEYIPYNTIFSYY